MPPHHHHGPPHHHGPHHHGWIVAHDAPELSRLDYAAALTQLGQLIERSSRVKINDVAVDVPDFVDFELVFERTPHGSLALRLRAEWPEDEGHVTSSSNGSLIFGVPADEED